MELDVGTTVTIIVQDALTSTSLCILVCAGIGGPKYYSSTAISNLSGTETLFQVDCTRTVGAGSNFLFNVRLYA